MNKNVDIEALRNLSEQLTKKLSKLQEDGPLGTGEVIKLEAESIQKITREARKGMKTTQEKISDLSGVAIGTVQKIEKGDLHVNLLNFIRVLEVMGIELCLKKK
jgi:DNA-binding XRE family transcriptional regulator